ncbi:hypothetical protein D3C71_1262610 [compost metagenome]
MLSLEAVALTPSSQTMGRASSALLARQKVSATTATVASSTRSTCFTPRRLAMAAASKLLSLPPCTGQALGTATSMPGRVKSGP